MSTAASVISASPAVIRRSAILLCISLLIGAITQLGSRLLGAEIPNPADFGRLLAFIMLAYGLSGWVVWELLRGRNWARIALSIWFLLSLFAWGKLALDGSATSGKLLLDGLVLLLDGSALSMVWHGAGHRWFSQPDEPDAPKPETE